MKYHNQTVTGRKTRKKTIKTIKTFSKLGNLMFYPSEASGDSIKRFFFFKTLLS